MLSVYRPPVHLVVYPFFIGINKTALHDLMGAPWALLWARLPRAFNFLKFLVDA